MATPSKTLHQAAATGDIALISSMIAQGADINAWDDWGHQQTPLIYAVEAMQIEAVKTLISLGADVNILGNDGLNHFHSPTYFAFAQIVDLLKEGYINENGTLDNKNQQDWQIKVESNDRYLEIAYELFVAGAKPADLSSESLSQLLSISASEGNLELVKLLVQDYKADAHEGYNYVFNAFVSAASNGKADVLDYLLSLPNYMFDHKSTLNEALVFAVSDNNSELDIAKMLIAAGADADGTSNRMCPIVYAIYNQFNPSNFEMAKLLLDNGANIEPLQEIVKNDILHYLVLDNYVEKVKAIYNFVTEYSEFTVDVNIRLDGWSYSISSYGDFITVETSPGDTPLHTAVQSNCLKGVEFLLELGANPTLENAQGESVLDYAMKYATDEVIVAITESYDTFKSEVPSETNVESTSYLDMFYSLFGSNNKTNSLDIKLNDVIDIQTNQPLNSLLDDSNMAQTVSTQPTVLIAHDVLSPTVLTHPEIL